MEAARSFTTSVTIYHVTRQHTAEDLIFFNTSNLTYAYTDEPCVIWWAVSDESLHDGLESLLCITDVGSGQQANRSGDRRSCSELTRSLAVKLKM
jgi:hypothetical protein